MHGLYTRAVDEAEFGHEPTVTDHTATDAFAYHSVEICIFTAERVASLQYTVHEHIHAGRDFGEQSTSSSLAS